MAKKKVKPFSLLRKYLYSSIRQTAQKLRHTPITLLDLKIIDASLKELCYTSKVFAPYHHVKKVTVFGSARVGKKDPLYKLAKEFGYKIAKLGYMVMTGAGPGIMRAAHEGAGSERSFGLNIRLPFEQEANPIIQGDAKLINYKYFFTRKLTMVKESNALVLFPGGFGTQDEMFETLTLLQTGKTNPTPVICIDKKRGTFWKKWGKFNLHLIVSKGYISKEDLDWLFFTDDIDQAVSHIANFYKNYYSIRFYQKWLLIYIWRLPNSKELKKISHQFKDIIVRGQITPVTSQFPFDPDIRDLPLKMIRFQFNQKNFGRLRKLIDQLNKY